MELLKTSWVEDATASCPPGYWGEWCNTIPKDHSERIAGLGVTRFQKAPSDNTSITTASLEGLPKESLFWPQDRRKHLEFAKRHSHYKTMTQSIPQDPHRNGSVTTKSTFCNGHLSHQTSIQSKTCGLSWRGQLISTNSRMWRILKGYAKRNGPKSLQMCSLTLLLITGRDSMLLTLPEVVAVLDEGCQ